MVVVKPGSVGSHTRTCIVELFRKNGLCSKILYCSILKPGMPPKGSLTTRGKVKYLRGHNRHLQENSGQSL